MRRDITVFCCKPGNDEVWEIPLFNAISLIARARAAEHDGANILAMLRAATIDNPVKLPTIEMWMERSDAGFAVDGPLDDNRKDMD